MPEEVPTITNLILHLDLTGSTYGEPAKKIAMLAIILKESAKFVPELQVWAVASQGGKPQLILGPSLREESEKQVLGGILATGCGQGDNEIDRNGIKFALEKTTEIPIPENRMAGKTHYLFLTDGGIASCIAEKFPDTIKAMLEDKNLEFDMMIIDGSEDNSAVRAIKEATWPKREPTVIVTPGPEKIAKEAVLHLTNQIRRNRILQPRPEKAHRQQIKRTIQKIDDIGMD